MKLVLLLGAPLLAACAAPSRQGPSLTGEWGGEHVRLVLTPTGGSVDYDCAAGTIIGPLVAHADGTFVAEGTHTPGHGGPDIQGRTNPIYRVSYSGRVQGDTLSLQARADNGLLLGPFTVRRGAPAVIFRCL